VQEVDTRQILGLGLTHSPPLLAASGDTASRIKGMMHDPLRAWELVVQYDGWPNGLKFHQDGRAFLTDYKRGLLALDPQTARLELILATTFSESFKGLNDLSCTDQGQTGMTDPTGRVYRLRPIGEAQQHIVSAVPPAYRVVLYRRYMLRLGARLAQHTGALALVTGESLGQVASQTLPNLAVIEAASPIPALRPLNGMDKAEIPAEAQSIGTYNTSILPDQDCCTLFVPRHPATKTALADIENAEQGLNMPALLQLAWDGLQTFDLRFPEPCRER
jgi:hypothetical protein